MNLKFSTSKETVKSAQIIQELLEIIKSADLIHVLQDKSLSWTALALTVKIMREHRVIEELNADLMFVLLPKKLHK